MTHLAGRESERGARPIYSDYYLARNIFHELMHVFQYDKWTNKMWGYEDFPTELDPQLPRDHFETKEYDEAGAKPLDDPLPPPPKKQ
jgi:hypothetical protein